MTGAERRQPTHNWEATKGEAGAQALGWGVSMRFPSRYALLVLAPLALSTGCSSRSMFTNSSGGSVFSLKRKTAGEELIAQEPPSAKKDEKAKDEPAEPKPKSKSPASDVAKSKSAAPEVAKSKSVAAPDVARSKPADKPPAARKSDSSADRLAKAQELEKNGDLDGAAKIYRDILADDAEPAPAKSQARTASMSSEEKPKIVAKKPADKKTESKDPWLDGQAPLPSTSPKSEKTIAAEVTGDRPNWARDKPKTGDAEAERQKVAAAFKKTDQTDLDDLDDLLDFAGPSESKAGGNPFAAREQGTSQDSNRPTKSPTGNRVVQRDQPVDLLKKPRDAKPAAEGTAAEKSAEEKFAARKPVSSDTVADAEPARESGAPAWARRSAAPSPVEAPEISSKKSLAELFEETPKPSVAKAAVDDSELVPLETKPSDTAVAKADDGPVWKSTRDVARSAGEEKERPFAAPTVRAEPVRTAEVPVATATTPAFGEERKVPSRAGWNSTSMERLCKDCDPMVRAEASKLDSPNADVRKEGILELARMGSVAQPACVALRAMLDDTDPLVQAYAAWALWELDHETLDSVQVLGGLLANSRPEVVELACYSLGNIGPEAKGAIPALKDLRDQSHGLERLRAAEALIRIQESDARSVDVLTVAVKSTDRQVRWIAANGLGQVRGKDIDRAIETLLLTLDDSDDEVKAAAALALGGMGAPARKALPKLQAMTSSQTPFVGDAADAAIKCLSR